MTPQALRNIMVNKEYEENWKEKISVETIDDIDELTLGKFRKKASNCGRLIDLEYSNLKELIELKRKTDKEQIYKLNSFKELFMRKKK